MHWGNEGKVQHDGQYKKEEIVRALFLTAMMEMGGSCSCFWLELKKARPQAYRPALSLIRVLFHLTWNCLSGLIAGIQERQRYHLLSSPLIWGPLSGYGRLKPGTFESQYLPVWDETILQEHVWGWGMRATMLSAFFCSPPPLLQHGGERSWKFIQYIPNNGHWMIIRGYKQGCVNHHVC